MRANPEISRLQLVSSGSLHGFSSSFSFLVQLVDVASGLNHLHLSDLVHGDLKGVNFAPD